MIPLADLARRLRLILIVNPVFGYPSPNGVVGEDHLLGREQLRELDRLCRRPFVYLNGGVKRLMLDGGNNSSRSRCRAVSATVVISPDNRLLLPCFHHAQESVPIAGNLLKALQDPRRERWLSRQGREAFCQGCAINCYLAPSLPSASIAISFVPSFDAKIWLL